MDETDLLARRFEEHRAHLGAVAYRMLGSRAEADDAVQEAWIRTSRADRGDVENLGGWLTTVVSRVCLNMLDARRRRREEALDEGHLPDPVVTRPQDADDPEREALVADAVGAALLVVLERLSAPERLAFVLHDMFGLAFEEIAPIVDRSPAAARQLASRARRRVQVGEDHPEAGFPGQRAVVDAFLAAARDGDFEGLLTVLDPDVVLRADDGSGVLHQVVGARAVASGASTYGRDTPRIPVPALIDHRPGVVFLVDGAPMATMAFTIAGGRVAEIAIINDPVRVAALDLSEVLAGGAP
jgi:RNA polymerase sigma-70 factor (ECF subfamily)